MKVYVINKHGRPLMPTTPRKARLLLCTGRAKIVGRDPFTIQLVYGSSGYTQRADLGIDAGYQNIGFSAVNEKEELIGGELKLLEGMSERITEKRKYRRTRRNRLRYRKPRWRNRKKKQGLQCPPTKSDTREVGSGERGNPQTPQVCLSAYQLSNKGCPSHNRAVVTLNTPQLCADTNNLSKERLRHFAAFQKAANNAQPVALCQENASGWLAPSIQHKLDTHHRLIEKISSVLPVRTLTIEVAAFDIQKINNPAIEGAQYQYGEKYGFDNLQEYILHRDGHKCQNPDCKNKADKPPTRLEATSSRKAAAPPILQVHHLGFWKNPPDRTDRPANLVTLCTKCHTPKNHSLKGFLFGWEPKLKSFKGETFMTIVRWRLTKEGEYDPTFGYITKGKRRELEMEKSHHNDAFVIAGGTTQPRVPQPLMLEQIRRNKRSMEQFYDAKYKDLRDGEIRKGSELSSGRRTRNIRLNGENLRKYRANKVAPGRRSIKKKRYSYKQHDIVLFEGKPCQVVGMQNLGTRLSLKPDADSKTKYKTADIRKVKPLRRRGGICGQPA